MQMRSSRKHTYAHIRTHTRTRNHEKPNTVFVLTRSAFVYAKCQNTLWLKPPPHLVIERCCVCWMAFVFERILLSAFVSIVLNNKRYTALRRMSNAKQIFRIYIVYWGKVPSNGSWRATQLQAVISVPGLYVDAIHIIFNRAWNVGLTIYCGHCARARVCVCLCAKAFQFIFQIPNRHRLFSDALRRVYRRMLW